MHAIKLISQIKVYLLCICSFLPMIHCVKDPEPVLLQSMRSELLPKGTISGIIMDFEGNPLSGVHSITKSGYAGVSKQDGSFIIDELPKGDYSLSLLRYGYFDTTLYIDDLGINENRTLSTLFLNSCLSNINGQVLSSNGTPVPNATVSLVNHPFSTKTDSKGNFTINRVTPGITRILAAHDTAGWGQASLQLSPGSDFNTTIILYHSRTGVIKGTVFKSDDTPDYGAIVSAAGGAFCDTAIKGTFILENIPCAIPLTISSGPSRMISGILVPESNPVLEIDLKELRSLQSGDISIFERQIFTLADDNITVFADIRYKENIISGYDNVAAFLWNFTINNTTYDTCTSVPFLKTKPVSGSTYRYGAITLSGDTLCCVPVTMIEKLSPSKVFFEESSFYPVNITLPQSDSVTLSWKAIDSGGRSLEYSVFFGGSNTNPPSLYRSGIIDTFLTVKPEKGWLENTYIWQIEAKCSKSNTRSRIISFTKEPY